MKLPLIFCFLVGITFGQRLSLMPKFMGGIGTALNQGIDLVHNAVKYGTNMTSNTVQTATDIGAMTLAAATSLGDKGVKGGVELGMQALDLANTIGDLVPAPGTGAVVNVATSLGKKGIKFGESLASKGLSVSNQVGGKLLAGANKGTQITTGTIENMSKAGTDIAKGAVDASLGMISNLVGAGLSAGSEFLPKSPPPTTTTTTTTTPKPSYFNKLWG